MGHGVIKLIRRRSASRTSIRWDGAQGNLHIKLRVGWYTVVLQGVLIRQLPPPREELDRPARLQHETLLECFFELDDRGRISQIAKREQSVGAVSDLHTGAGKSLYGAFCS